MNPSSATWAVPLPLESVVERIVATTEPASKWFFSSRRFIARPGKPLYVAHATPTGFRLRRRSSGNLVHNLYAVSTLTLEGRGHATVATMSTRSTLRPWMLGVFFALMLGAMLTLIGQQDARLLPVAFIPLLPGAVIYFVSRAVERSDHVELLKFMRVVFPEAEGDSATKV